MKYSIEPIFLIFPALCLLVSVLNKKQDKKIDLCLGAGFILIYSFSLNGADYKNYEVLYNLLARGQSIFAIHGEPGFNLMMSLCGRMGMKYIVFRILLLVITTVVLFWCMHKTSGNFSLSLFLVSSMFLIYTISTYRQYVVMVFSIFWMIQYNNGRKWLSILGTAFLVLFHIAAILPLLFLLIYHFISEENRRAVIGFINRNFTFLIAFALLLRVFAYLLLKTDVMMALFYKLLRSHVDDVVPTLISAGLISRVACLILTTYIYRMKKTGNMLQQMLFLFYSTGMLLYIVVPWEYLMGRLMNNAYILAVILIPALIAEPFSAENRFAELTEGKQKSIRLAALGIVMVAFAVLLSQLARQSGYYPYGNIILNLLK